MELHDRRLTVRFDPELLSRLRAFAHSRGSALAPAVRLLVGEAVSRHQASSAELAALIGIQEAVLLLRELRPLTSSEERELRLRAIEAAQAALAFLETVEG